MKKIGKMVLVALFGMVVASSVYAKGKNDGGKMENLQLDSKWDKTFSLDDSVSHKKVTFTNHFGIALAADMYTPKVIPAGGKFAAIAVCGPFGAVKEQSSGLYAHEMAKRGFLTIAFDPSFCGESGGQPRYMNSADINTEDFQAAVDFLSVQENVAPEKIGLIGICGWGGMALNAVGIDTRVKATAVMTMYDMSRISAGGYFDENDNEESRHKNRVALNKARTECFANGEYPTQGGLPNERPSAEGFFQQYWDYYKTERGYHPRSLNSNMGWAATSTASMMNTRLLRYSNEIRSAVLIVHGENAHSRYMGETAYNDMIAGNKFTENKELLIIPNATHCDLYDGGKGNFIPWEKLTDFFTTNMM